MKLAALSASAVALTLAFTAPASAMDKVNKDFVILSTASWAVAVTCPGYDVVTGSPQKVADMNGANFDVLGPALIAAWNAQIDKPYERNDLIPEVTIEARATLSEFTTDVKKNKIWACAKWAKAVMPVGMIKHMEKVNAR
jgi:hypothetical protein